MFDDMCSTFFVKRMFCFQSNISANISQILKCLAGFTTLLNKPMLYNNVRSFSLGYKHALGFLSWYVLQRTGGRTGFFGGFMWLPIDKEKRPIFLPRTLRRVLIEWNLIHVHNFSCSCTCIKYYNSHLLLFLFDLGFQSCSYQKQAVWQWTCV